MVFQIARRVAALDGGGNSAVDAVVMSVDSSIERRSPTANPTTDPNYFEKTQLSLRGGQLQQSPGGGPRPCYAFCAGGLAAGEWLWERSEKAGTCTSSEEASGVGTASASYGCENRSDDSMKIGRAHV